MKFGWGLTMEKAGGGSWRFETPFRRWTMRTVALNDCCCCCSSWWVAEATVWTLLGWVLLPTGRLGGRWRKRGPTALVACWLTVLRCEGRGRPVSSSKRPCSCATVCGKAT